jgi:hypothetical protein
MTNPISPNVDIASSQKKILCVLNVISEVGILRPVYVENKNLANIIDDITAYVTA